MEYSIRLKIAGGAIALAAVIGLSIVTSTVVASRAYEKRGQREAARSNEVSVRGSARQRITSDLGVWNVRVHVEGKDLIDTFSSLESGVSKVFAFLVDKGFDSNEIELCAVDTQMFFRRDAQGHETREVTSCAMDRQFIMSSTQVAKIAKASGEVTLLLKDGVQVFSTRPSYYYTKLPDLRITIVGDAAADAKVRAQEVVAKSGARVGEVRHLSTGPVQVTQPNSTDVSGSGAYDTLTIDKDVSVTVSATFGVES